MVKSTGVDRLQQVLLEPDLELRVQAHGAERGVLVQHPVRFHLAVVAAGRSEDEPLDVVALAQLEEILGALPDRARGQLGLRFAGGIADDRGEVHHCVEVTAAE